MPPNASLKDFNLPPLDRPRPRDLGELGLRLQLLASTASALARKAGRWSARAAAVIFGNDMPAGGDFPLIKDDDAPELTRLGGETEWGRATERLATGNRQADDARRYHVSATDQLDAAFYEMRMLMKELAPVVAAGLPVAATAEVVRIAEPPQPPAMVPAVAVAKTEKRRKSRKNAPAAAA